MTTGSPPPAPRSPAGDWAGIGAGAILVVGIVAIYARTFSVPLLFDDRTWLTLNPSLLHLRALGTVLSPPLDSGTGGRPLINLIDALNYAAGGTSVTGYHVVNLAIHVLAALTLFALVRRTLLLPAMADRFGPAATALALAVSAVWAWHPVLTESVTYLAQRSESLMGLFYLLTLYCFVRGASAAGPGGRWGWFSLAVLACLAGVGSKEVIATAPLLVLLYDRTFLSGSFAQAWKRHWGILLALAATWVPLGFLMAGLRLRGVGFNPVISWRAYGLVEIRVVVKYLLLAVWPRPLVFDYGAFVPARWTEIWPYAVVLAALLAATVAAIRRVPAAGFAACWFFLILAPSSSIVPVFSQPMAENRLYLPVAGVAALAVLGLFALAGRRSLALFAVLAVGLGLASAARNQDYLTADRIWTDTVAKVPQSPRGHSNLAAILIITPGRGDDAVAEYAKAVALEPRNGEGYYNLGNALGRVGRIREACDQYEEAILLKPDLTEAHACLGTIWSSMPGHLDDALAEYQKAARLAPHQAGVHNDLGNAWYAHPGHMADAIAEYHEALRLDPNLPEAHSNLGNALLTQPGMVEEAVAEYQTTVRLKPDVAANRISLARALLRLPGRSGEARAEAEAALRLEPGNGAAQQLLGSLAAATPRS
jgi:tetratricopeptide (TPR) repeat protein